MARRLIDTLWGSTGAVTDPGDTKLNLGWIAEIPTHQVQNYWQNRIEEMVQWIEQHGIQDWSALTTYADTGLCLGSNGVVYQSVQAANLNHTPIADGGTWWDELNHTASLVAAGGYIQFPGETPFIIQFGVENVAGDLTGIEKSITLPLSYPNVHAMAVGNMHITTDAADQEGSAKPNGLSSLYLSNANTTAEDIYWLSIGW